MSRYYKTEELELKEIMKDDGYLDMKDLETFNLPFLRYYEKKEIKKCLKPTTIPSMKRVKKED